MRATGLTILFFLLSAGGTFLADDLATPSFPLLDKKVVFSFPVITASNTQKKSSVIDTTELKNSNWYSQVIKNIEESEYEIKYDELTHSYASPNRKQNLRAFYTGDNFTLLPRNDSADKWKLSLQLKGIYTSNQKLSSSSNNPVVTQNGNNIQFNHNNEFITEYINSKEGVRQNFIISKKPSGNPKNLKVELEANKGWFINKVADKEIHFAKATQNGYNKKITYNGLKVWDADGKELEAFFAINKNTISINVNTSDAVYPITIDPISTTASTQLESNQTNAFMGYSVASAGDVNGDGYSDVIVGVPLYLFPAPFEVGGAFLFHGSSTGITTTIQAQLKCDQTSQSDFGYTVSSAGDVNNDGYSDVIVGARIYTNIESQEGAAFVFLGSATGIITTIQAQLEINQAVASMGQSVACAGDVNGDGYSDVIVGATLYDNLEFNEGAAFIYHGSAAGITATIQTQLEFNQPSAAMGSSVGSAGDVNGDGYSDVIVGAVQFSNMQGLEGAAFVFHGSAAGITTTIQTQLESNQATAFMGRSVASAGDVNGDGYSDVIVGADDYDNVESNEGAALVYHGSASGITTTIQALLEVNQIDAGLGRWVASSGDVNGDGYSDVIVGAYQYDNGQSNEGAAFVFHGSATGINTTIQTQLESNQPDAEFGTSVASAGDVNGDGYSDVIAGAPNYDNGNSNEGAAFVYHGSPDGLSASPVNTPDDADQGSANFGISVACAGDVNSDGFSDVIIGAYQYDDGGNSDEGRAFVYHASASGLSATPNSTLDDADQADALFGWSVSSAGDVNGDGYSDVIIGAYYYDDGGNADEGRAFVYFGSSSGLSATPNSTPDDADQANALFGFSVATAGDVNGDGYSDVIIGAEGYDDGGNTDEGRAFVYYGSASGLSSTPNSTPDDADQANAFFGIAVSSAGDVNGDGYSDVIIGAAFYNDGANIDEGRAFVYHGSASGLSATPNSSPDDADQAGIQFARSVASAGDVNGDGYSDVIVGAYLYTDGGNTSEGRAFVYYGSATGLSATPNSTPNDADQSFAGFGRSVASAGDVNGDGYSDVIIGAFQYTDGANTYEGRAFVYFGSATGLSATPNNTPDAANQGFAYFGYSVSSAGDINGDGYSDVIIGAYLYTDGFNTNEGRAFVYYGNNTGGLRNNLRLYNQDLVTPIQQSSIAPALFGAGLYAKSPLGRQKGKLVWETVKNGQPFSGNPITNSTLFLSQQSVYTDLGLTGVELKNQIAKVFAVKATYLRARVKYDPVTAITGQVYGPWRYPESFLRGNRDIGAVALPVKFISFVALKQNDNTVLLRWITTDETPGIEYEVQHSNDGIHFQTIKNISGIGNSRNEYDWLHNNPSAGKNFYRIHTIENGNDVFTAIRQINFDKNIRMIIYPNPAKSGSQLTVELANSPASGVLSVELFSNSGQKKAGYSIASGNNNIINITLPELPAGGYILRLIKDRKELYSGSFVVVQ